MTYRENIQRDKEFAINDRNLLPATLWSRLSYIAGLLTSVAGFIVLVGWQFDITILKSFFPDAIIMKANTAAAFVFTGLALMLLQRDRPFAKVPARVCAVVVMLVGLLSICSYVFNRDIGINEILYHEPPGAPATSQPGLMSPGTALNFIFIGCALYLITISRFSSGYFVEFFLVFSLIISAFGIAGRMTGLLELTGPASFTQMASNTALIFIALIFGMLFTAYERQHSPVTIEQKLFAGLTSAAAVIVFITFLSISGISSLLRADGWVEHSQQVRNRVEAVLTLVLEVQSGDRGFVLTGDESYLESHDKAAEALPALFDSIRKQTADNPRQQESFALLEKAVTERVAYSELRILARKSGGEDKARVLYPIGSGKAMTDSIRSMVTQIVAEENEILKSRNEDEIRQAIRTQTIMYISLGVQVLLLSFIFVVVRKDVTGRRKAEEETRRMKDLLDSIVENIPAMIFLKDAKDLRFVRFNKAGEDLLGFGREDLMGKNDYDFFPKSEADFFTTKDREVLSGEDAIDIPEEPIQTKHKGVRFLHTRKISMKNDLGVPEYLLGISVDITERKRAEEELRQLNEELESRVEQRTASLRKSEARFRSTLDNMLEGCQIIGSDWRYIYINDAADEHNRRPKEELLGKRYMDMWPGIESTNVFAVIRRCMEERISHHMENEFAFPDGVKGWFELSIQPVSEGVFILSYDITKRKQIEQEIRQLNTELEQRVIERTAQLEAANKELEAFSYSVSHDLRAPLRSIDGFSQAILTDYNDKLDAQGKDFLNRVRAASQRMAILIDDMLKLSRITRAEMHREKVDLSKLVQEAADELKKNEPARIVDFVIAGGLVEFGDPQLLRVVVDNLLGNAWKYTGKKPAARIEFGATQKNGGKVYFIKDNGVGFDMAYASKLFGAFQRLHSTAEFDGTGIGLATVQRIIHRHGGKIWGEAKVNEGATFYFTL